MECDTKERLAQCRKGRKGSKMITKLIGFEVSKGSFTNEKTGELVEYSNRNLNLITDSGEDESHVGYSFYSEKKIKMKNLAKWLNIVTPKELPKEYESENEYLDIHVNKALKNLIGKVVSIDRAPRNGELEVVGIAVVENPLKSQAEIVNGIRSDK